MEALELSEVELPHKNRGGAGIASRRTPRSTMPCLRPYRYTLVGVLGMCRVFYVCCMLVLLGSVGFVYAQEATIPVTIILQGSEPASPELRVNPTELEVAQSSMEDLEVWLSLRPEGRVTVSLLVTHPPSTGNAEDIVLFPSSLSFEVDNHDERQSVEVRALSVAEPGEYTIELTASGGGVTDTETVTVTVIDGLGFQPLSRVELYPGDSGTLHAILIGTPSPRRKAITVRATILESGWEAHLELDPTEWRYDLDDDIISQSIEVTAKDNAEPGVYRLVLTASREGDPNVREQGEIEILPDPCTVTPSIKNLNFGAWARPDPGVSGVISFIPGGFDRYETNMTPVVVEGVEKSLGEYRLSLRNCSTCSGRITINGFRLTGESKGGTIDFVTSVWVRDRSPLPSIGVTQWPIGHLVSEDGPELLIEFGGELTGINSNTPSDIYSGDRIITIVNTCQ